MNTQPAVAKFYLRWITKIGPGTYVTADNAPIQWRAFLSRLPNARARQMAPAILEHIANRSAYEAPPREVLLEWIVANPELDRRADSILSQKTSPKSFAELLDKIYRSEIREISQLVTEFLKQQLAD